MNDAVAIRKAEANLSSTQDHAAGRRTTRPAGWILIAFHAACDIRDLEVAGNLLGIFETAVLAGLDAPEDRRHAMDLIGAGHERLWHLKHPLHFSRF